MVLRINSPGGSVSGSEAILFELIRAREAGLPVVVSMGPVAASGGYWIATASDKILAGPQTITGSIGVFGILPNVESLGSGYGLSWDRVKTNPSSDILSIARPKTEEEISTIQEYVNQTYERFLSLVGDSRNLPPGEVENLAEGRVWTGQEAYDLGLVDDLGGLSQAIAMASDLAGLGTSFDIEEFPKIKTPTEALASLLEVRQEGISLGGSTVPKTLLKKLSDAQPILRSLNDPLGMYGILPWYRARLGFSPWKMKL